MEAASTPTPMVRNAIIEVALLGVLNRRDLADGLRRHGAKARRESISS